MFLENVRSALAALLENRLRSLLTLLGVVIGVFAVTATVSLGEIATAGITGELQAFGAQSLFVIREFDHPDGRAFTDADIEALSRLPIEILRQRSTRVWATAGDVVVTMSAPLTTSSRCSRMEAISLRRWRLMARPP